MSDISPLWLRHCAAHRTHATCGLYTGECNLDCCTQVVIDPFDPFRWIDKDNVGGESEISMCGICGRVNSHNHVNVDGDVLHTFIHPADSITEPGRAV